MTTYNAFVANGHEVGSGFDAEVISDGKRAVLSIYNVSRKQWSMVELADPPQSDAECKRVAIDAASCPGPWRAVEEAGDEFDHCLAIEAELKAASERVEAE